MKRWLLAAIALIALIGFCDDTETVKVRAKGVGSDRTEALKDAYRDAIERAVGLYVDAEQMVKNEELVKDQILTHSNAYIEKYNVVIEGKTPSGLVSVTILANVRRQDLVQKIKSVMPAQEAQISDVSKALHAQIVTKFKSNDDALAILKNELEGLSPVKQLMKVSLADAKPVVESVKEDSSLVRLWYPIKVEVDSAKYYNEFVPRWSRILNQIKVAPAKRLDLTNNQTYVKAYGEAITNKYGTKRKNRIGIMTRCAHPDDIAWLGLSLNEEYRGVSFLESRILGRDYVLNGCALFEGIPREKNARRVDRVFYECEGLSRCLQGDVPGDCAFCVGLVTVATGRTLSGSLYKIPQACADEIVAWQHRVVGGVREGYDFFDSRAALETDFSFRLVDENGTEVVGRTFAVRNLDVMNAGCVILESPSEVAMGGFTMVTGKGNRSENAGGTRLWLISPIVGAFAKSYVKWVSVDLPKDDVAKIATAAISVEE